MAAMSKDKANMRKSDCSGRGGFRELPALWCSASAATGMPKISLQLHLQ